MKIGINQWYVLGSDLLLSFTCILCHFLFLFFFPHLYFNAFQGFGTLGRSVARVALQRDDIEVVAVNDPRLTARDMVCMCMCVFVCIYSLSI